MSSEMKQAQQQVRDKGYRVSAGSWEDEHIAVAFSVESHGPATYGHPKFTAEVDKPNRFRNVPGTSLDFTLKG